MRLGDHSHTQGLARDCNPLKLNSGQFKYIHVEHIEMGTKNCDFWKSQEYWPSEPNGGMRILFEPPGGLGHPIRKH